MNRTNLIPGRPLRSLASLLLLAVMAGCSHEQFETEDLPTGKFRVEVSLSGVAGGISPWRASGSSATPPSPLAQDYRPSAAPAPVPDHWSRAITRAEEPTLPFQKPWEYEQHNLADPNSSFYNGNKTQLLPKGETLRLIACNEYGTIIEQKTYVVGEDDNLYPCTVNPDGSLKDSGSTPLYLDAGNYFFYALSPARELVGDNETGLLVDNGEYLLSNDWRYTQTVPTTLTTEKFNTGNKAIRLTLNPIINQTARLKFSLYTDDQDLHNLQPSDAGLSVSGLQVPYDKDGVTAKDQCNWAVGDTLRMAYGYKDAEDIAFAYTRETINVPTDDGGTVQKEALVITTAILPTDATSQPLVVMFRGKLNGIPSTYSMMLNEKTFRAGHSYNYVGKVKMKGGVAAIEWQVVTWNSDIYIGNGNGDAGTGGVPCPDTEQ